MAEIFLVGCPACAHNFKHFFCLLTCAPDQATFANVTAAQTAPDTGAANTVAEMDYFVAGGRMRLERGGGGVAGIGGAVKPPLGRHCAQEVRRPLPLCPSLVWPAVLQ